jgi:hypothetical protein
MEPPCEKRERGWLRVRIRQMMVALYRTDLGGVGVVSISFENNRKSQKTAFAFGQRYKRK